MVQNEKTLALYDIYRESEEIEKYDFKFGWKDIFGKDKEYIERDICLLILYFFRLSVIFLLFFC